MKNEVLVKKAVIKMLVSMSMAIILLQSVFAASWPAESSGTNVGSALPAYYEPSGIVYHTGLNKLFVVSDEGMLSMMNTDGTSVTSWSFHDAFNYNDFEGVAVADSTSNYVYVLTEYPFAITQFDISSGTVVQSWSLSSIISAPTNTKYGLEGMTYVSTEGLFAVGSQETGTIYFVSVPTTTTAGQVSLVRSIKPTSSVSDLFFDAETNTLYILAGSSLTEADTQGTIIAQYTVPGSGQEGVTLAPSCPTATTSIFIAEDLSATNLVPVVYKYNSYPVTCSSSSGSGSGSSTTTASWPASSSGTNVGSGLSSTFEPSGVVWNAGSSKLIAINDNGGVSTMNSDGSSVTTWSLSGDLEGAAIADASTNYVYVVNEYPFALYEFDVSTGTKIKSWDLSNIGIKTPSTTANGLEGVAFIPDGLHSYSTTASGGIFAFGSSDDGTIYFVSVPLSTNGGAPTLLGSVTPAAEAITDLYYSEQTGVLYALYGSTTATTLRELSAEGTVTTTYTSVPGTDPEGITFVPDCTANTASVYIANDEGNTVMEYAGYPFTCTSSGTSTTTTIDPNLISSYSIDTVNALVTVYYADGHTNTINPFTGTDPILVGLNYDSTVLIVSNGIRIYTFQNAVRMDREYITKYIPSSFTLTITPGTSSDTVVVQYIVSGKTSTKKFTLTGTNLVRV